MKFVLQSVKELIPISVAFTLAIAALVPPAAAQEIELFESESNVLLEDRSANTGDKSCVSKLQTVDMNISAVCSEVLVTAGGSTLNFDFFFPGQMPNTTGMLFKFVVESEPILTTREDIIWRVIAFTANGGEPTLVSNDIPDNAALCSLDRVDSQVFCTISNESVYLDTGEPFLNFAFLYGPRSR